MTKAKIEYRCTLCGAEGVKLWREYQTFADQTELLCVDCAEKSPLASGKKCRLNFPRLEAGGKYPDVYSDQIGWLVPAVPDVEAESFWGYTSVPQDRVEWWKQLPLCISSEPRQSIER
jgi:hypothetical protein